MCPVDLVGVATFFYNQRKRSGPPTIRHINNFFFVAVTILWAHPVKVGSQNSAKMELLKFQMLTKIEKLSYLCCPGVKLLLQRFGHIRFKKRRSKSAVKYLNIVTLITLGGGYRVETERLMGA